MECINNTEDHIFIKGCIARRIEGKGSGIVSLLDQSRIEVLGRSERSGI